MQVCSDFDMFEAASVLNSARSVLAPGLKTPVLSIHSISTTAGKPMPVISPVPATSNNEVSCCTTTFSITAVTLPEVTAVVVVKNEMSLTDESAAIQDREQAALALAGKENKEPIKVRGENVRNNPQMQKTARDGQKHWHEKVKQMRLQYDFSNTDMVHPQFGEQRFMCMELNLKCQKESLLIFLQFATQQDLISPLPFVHASDPTAGFLGWTGFVIRRGCGKRFRAGVEALFPEPPKLNTLYHLFRRSGLVPENWRRAWDGEFPFKWNAQRFP
jgi:hypothetical protein